MDYLSNQEAVECIQLILNFANNLPPKALADLGQDLANLLQTRFQGKSGIIYCLSRKDCEQLSELLKRNY